MNELITNRKRIYWISQILGWGIYTLFNIIVLLSYQGYDWGKILLFIYIGIMGISFTHIFRIIIHNKKWMSLSFKQLIPRALIGSVLTAVIIVGITFFILYATNIYQWEKFRFILVAMNIFNISVILLLWSFIYFSIHYFENYKTSEIERLIWEAAVKDFELKTLKSQLNPHFMFNALNSIRALIEENPESAKTSITQLSNIFRYSLRIERTETVPLEEEIKTVMDYLSLEQVRFEERLQFKVDVAPETRNIEIPPMMVQTLVENSIKHGVSKISEGGFVELSTSLVDNALHILIKNTGSVNETDILQSKGYGISNTKQRLNILYGVNATFSLKNVNGYVSTELIIPLGGTNT